MGKGRHSDFGLRLQISLKTNGKMALIFHKKGLKMG